MRGFSRCYLYMCILIDQSRSDIMTEEHSIYRYAPASIGDPDFSAYPEILHRCLDQVFCPGRTIHIDRLGALVVPGDRHQRSEARRVIVVKMSEENGSNIPDIDSGFGDPARRPIAGVNDIQCSIDNQQV